MSEMNKDGDIEITKEIVNKCIDENRLKVHKGDDVHYDTISAFIKSVRGSDENAAIYYLARMLKKGEDIEFMGRRLVILAAEDIGLADPNALVIANAGLEAVKKIGMPEARIILAEVTIYLAKAKKSNSAYNAINQALSDMEKEEILKSSVKELEKLVEDGKITKKEIYEIYLENIQKEDDKIGAYLSVSDVVEEKIPIAIKDNVNVIGTKTTSASKILENYVSPYDATIIKYIKEAGYRNNW